jgi:hypothetical protein
MTSAVAVLVNEERLPLGERSISLSVSGSELIENSKLRIMQLWNSVKQPSIFLPTLFIFLWQATPQSDSAMFYFMYVPQTSFISLITLDCSARFVFDSNHNFGALKTTCSSGNPRRS